MQTFMPMDTIAQVAYVITYKAEFSAPAGLPALLQPVSAVVVRRRGAALATPAAS